VCAGIIEMRSQERLWQLAVLLSPPHSVAGLRNHRNIFFLFAPIAARLKAFNPLSLDGWFSFFSSGILDFTV
jgi:hypothetical protein